MRYRNLQDVYDHAESVLAALRSAGFSAQADRINDVLHETAWTTGNELLGELGLRFREVLETSGLPVSIAADLEDLVRQIGRVLKGKS